MNFHRLIEHFLHTNQLWTKAWNLTVDLVGDDEYILLLWLVQFISCLSYAVTGGAYLIIDITNKPKFLQKYKIQPDVNVPLNLKLLWKGLKTVVFNIVIINIIANHVIYFGVKLVGIEFDRRVTSSFSKIVLDLLVLKIFYDIFFYYTHRLLHHRLLYKHTHKRHHEWTAPIAIMGAYSHWFGKMKCSL